MLTVWLYVLRSSRRGPTVLPGPNAMGHLPSRPSPATRSPTGCRCWTAGGTTAAAASTRGTPSHTLPAGQWALGYAHRWYAAPGCYTAGTRWVNSLAPGKFERNFRYVIFKQILVIVGSGILGNCHNMNVTGLHWWSVNIGSGNGLVLSGNKPLPEPKLTQISVAIWCH